MKIIYCDFSKMLFFPWGRFFLDMGIWDASKRKLFQESILAHFFHFLLRVLQADRNIVLAAVANDGFAVRHASDALRADREAGRSISGGN